MLCYYCSLYFESTVLIVRLVIPLSYVESSYRYESTDQEQQRIDRSNLDFEKGFVERGACKLFMFASALLCTVANLPRALVVSSRSIFTQLQ